MRKYIKYLLLVVFAGIFLFSAYKLWSIFSEYRASENYYSGMQSSFVVEKDNTQGGTSQQTSGTTELPNTAPVEIDFDALKAVNDDVVGWLYCEDTVINYPIVQGDDNAYYLHRLLDGSYNSGGTLFLDYRNAGGFLDGNAVVYGHNMKDGSMFGSFMKYKEESYYDEHPVMYLLTPEADYRIELFSGYVTDYKSEAYTKTFESDEEIIEFIENSRVDSTFESDVEPSIDDMFITLSTCSYEFDNARYVLVGRLVLLERDGE